MIFSCVSARLSNAISFALAIVATSSVAFAESPNIIFILADDLGWRDLGCYGSTFHETPHLDRLAQQGVRFTQAYTAGTVCSPTRSSIMAGRVPARTGVTDYIPGLTSKGRKLTTRPTAKQMSLNEITIAESLKQHGYQTFYAGKWHLGDEGYLPTDQGFDVAVLDKELGNHGRDWQVGQRLTDASVEFLEQRDKAKPFFMFLGYHEPHTPILEYPKHLAKFQAKKSPADKNSPPRRSERDGQTRLDQDDPAYASEVAGLDDFVGQVCAAVDSKGLNKSTLIVFFSDNGGLSTKADPGPTSNEPLRAGKGWLYEGGIRVPCIIRRPDETQPGRVIETPIYSTDFYPSLLEFAGAPLQNSQHLDGVSFIPLLNGLPPSTRDTFYWHYPHYHGSTWAPGGAIREGHWKLIEFFEENRSELYDLSSDLSEKQNLIDKEPMVAERLRSKLTAWRKAVGAYVPEPEPDFSKYEKKSRWVVSEKAIASASKNHKTSNFVESQVKPYTLPTLMQTSDGQAVVTLDEWRIRRAEILQLYQSEVFGVAPPAPENLTCEVIHRDDQAMQGEATLTVKKLSFLLGQESFSFQLKQFVPNHRQGPAPAFILLNHRGPENTDVSRSQRFDFWPAEYVVSRGYSMAVVDVAAEVDPDDAKNTTVGVRAFYRTHDATPDKWTWGTLAAWAWSGSRAMDCLEKDNTIDAKRVAVIGHSRTGKTALWAAASDERFAMACVNGAGEGGPALARRHFGETLGQITNNFSHWFTPKYRAYADKIEALPVDAHMLIALVAPRGYHGGDGTTDLWADPRGSWLALVEASRAWELYGQASRMTDDMPLVNDLLVNGPLAYHIHEGGHGLEVFDWKLYVDHAERLGWGK
jgi:arylsulfatase A-like enzyme/dienelactone hydrolase